mmetsp:Transcript_40135/g.113505  ORF Transcript_40135/g.113505 Transcript_40135/m.113505 type:complete len:221 (-) Transcript_40135:669-1331(-)
MGSHFFRVADMLTACRLLDEDRCVDRARVRFSFLHCFTVREQEAFTKRLPQLLGEEDVGLCLEVVGNLRDRDSHRRVGHAYQGILFSILGFPLGECLHHVDVPQRHGHPVKQPFLCEEFAPRIGIALRTLAHTHLLVCAGFFSLHCAQTRRRRGAATCLCAQILQVLFRTSEVFQVLGHELLLPHRFVGIPPFHQLHEALLEVGECPPLLHAGLRAGETR